MDGQAAGHIARIGGEGNEPLPLSAHGFHPLQVGDETVDEPLDGVPVAVFCCLFQTLADAAHGIEAKGAARTFEVVGYGAYQGRILVGKGILEGSHILPPVIQKNGDNVDQFRIYRHPDRFAWMSVHGPVAAA